MEANFTLVTMRQQQCFRGKITEKRLHSVFKIDEPLFWQIIELILGEEFLKSEHRNRSNIDIASAFMAWGLELESKEEVLRAMEKCVKLEWRGGIICNRFSFGACLATKTSTELKPKWVANQMDFLNARELVRKTLRLEQDNVRGKKKKDDPEDQELSGSMGKMRKT
ncbi:hypothetical protein SUGI_0453480 [Cryptomeria japonica]|nr:hypothetical protein SUGI_0453480 [Cryptomeria japonica]